MNAIAISFIVLVCLFGGALIGMRVRTTIPQDHLSDDSKHMLEASLGIIGTMAGLVLGLLVASSFGTYNAQRNELIDLSSKVILLDRGLALYGPEAEGVRKELRVAIQRTLDQIWPANGAEAANLDPSGGSQIIYESLEKLDAKTDTQKSIKAAALGLLTEIAQTRWLMYEQLSITFSVPLLIVLVFWFTITFAALGLFAPRNATVVAALFLCAVAVSGAVFLIQDLSTPFQGPTKLASTPITDALAHLGERAIVNEPR